MKKSRIDNKKLTLGIICLLIILISAVILFQKTTEPVNPIGDRQTVSTMWHTNTSLLVDQDKISKIDSANINNSKQDEKSEAPAEEEEEIEEMDNVEDSQESGDGNGDSSAETPDISQIVDIDKNSQSSGEQQGNNPGQSNSGNDTSDEGERVDAYFTTSIISGDIVTDEEYSFTIKHLKPELTVAGIVVTVNGEETDYAPKTGRFENKLSVGENKIVVEVMYKSGKNNITASKGYTIYYVPADEVVIITDLFDRTIDQETIDFSAYGLRGDERLQASVKVNGKKVSGSGEDFTAKLQLGENLITITAGGRKDSVTKTFKVTYAENIFKVVTTISDTVLYGTENQTQPEAVVYTGVDENYKFKVHVNKVTGKEKLVKVRAFFYDGSNGKTLQKDANGYYSVKIPTRGAVLLTLTYLDSEGDEHRYEYVVRFNRTEGTTPVDKYPSINALVEVGSTILNLKTGMEFKSPSIIININAKSWQNEPLYGSDFVVNVNGYTYPQNDYQQGVSWYGYDVHLKEGENTVTITVTDQDKYSVTKVYKLYYTPGKVKVTISVEATTVGLGYIIPKQTVEVDGGTSVAQIVTDLLKKNGYNYRYTGTIENSFYLAAITGTGITNGYKIPDDLKAMIEADGGDISMMTGPASSDSLGEFDFYRYSGWMYSYNGSYPGYSMASCRPQDGAVIRIRFTLALGKDIGGYTSGTGIYDNGSIKGNYGKEW